MRENQSLTQGWYYRRQLIRCLYLLPENGMDKELFLSCLSPSDMAAEARKCFSKGQFVRQEGNRIRPRSPLLFQEIHPLQEQVVGFLARLYQSLESFVEEERKQEVKTLKDEAEILCKQYDRLHLNPEDLSSIEAQVLEKAAPLIRQLRFTRIGGLEHLKGEIRNAHNVVGVVYFRHFGSERRNAIRMFHAEFGECICSVFQKAIDTVQLNAILTENLLDLMCRYYALAEMFPELALISEKLLAIQTTRNAPAWLLAVTHQWLSDGHFGSFKDNPDNWLTLSNYHLDKAYEYERISYEEFQQEKEES